ncbi:MAG: nucleotidyl transferase AbiEii/AbiGii toxin family protein [Candidatus Marinimicrobia bacterium]|nr:nucleotidyl transferase AbiEii/AbiGii toxin family protein [Candidatus Neomarinimicrobiota bacterium]
MFEYTKYELDELSRKTQFMFGPLEKALRLIDILRTFNSHPVLKDQFVLKGGTALNLFYLDVPRLSVDVDLNFIGELEREPSLRARQNIEVIIPAVFSGEYKVECSRSSYANLQYKLSYITLHGGGDALKLDINFLERITILDKNILEFDKWGENLTFPNLNLIELLTGKTRAFLTRYTARDLYDLYRINKLQIEFDHGVLHELFLYALLTASESYSDLFPPKWEEISSADVVRNLHPMLIRGDDPKVNSMKDGARHILKHMIYLNETEIEIIEQFYTKGEIKLDSLFEDSLVERVSKSPAFQWKKKNLKRLSS